MPAILYSFRRCPYAMRARLALASSGVTVELREILLREKPDDFLAASPSGTVPCLKTEARVIDESLDVMTWALAQQDPAGWLSMPEAGWHWISRADGPFKHALDRTKYHSRYPSDEKQTHLADAAAFLAALDQQIDSGQIDNWIFDHATLADYAILPFVRQFAFIDKPWFDAQPWPHLQAWLARFLASDQFTQIMDKYPQWHRGDAVTLFPAG